jgi:hypothetical protein
MVTSIATTITGTQNRKTATPASARTESPEDVDRVATSCFFDGLPDYANVEVSTIELIAEDNTPYAWFWVDLRNGPLVIEVPPKVLCLINDTKYRWGADLGVTGPGSGNNGKYLLLPSDYEGEAPGGYNVVRPHTLGDVVVWRSFRVDSDPKLESNVAKRFTIIYPLT